MQYNIQYNIQYKAVILQDRQSGPEDRGASTSGDPLPAP